MANDVKEQVRAHRCLKSFSKETAARLAHDAGTSYLGRDEDADEAGVEEKGQSLNSSNPRECTRPIVRLWAVGNSFQSLLHYILSRLSLQNSPGSQAISPSGFILGRKRLRERAAGFSGPCQAQLSVSEWK